MSAVWRAPVKTKDLLWPCLPELDDVRFLCDVEIAEWISAVVAHSRACGTSLTEFAPRPRRDRLDCGH